MNEDIVGMILAVDAAIMWLFGSQAGFQVSSIASSRVMRIHHFRVTESNTWLKL